VSFMIGQGDYFDADARKVNCFNLTGGSVIQSGRLKPRGYWVEAVVNNTYPLSYCTWEASRIVNPSRIHHVPFQTCAMDPNLTLERDWNPLET